MHPTTYQTPPSSRLARDAKPEAGIPSYSVNPRHAKLDGSEIFPGQLPGERLNIKEEDSFDNLVRIDPQNALNKALLLPRDSPTTWRLLGKLVDDPTEIGEAALSSLMADIQTADDPSVRTVNSAASAALVKCADKIADRHPGSVHYEVMRVISLLHVFLGESFDTTYVDWECAGHPVSLRPRSHFREDLLMSCLQRQRQIIEKGFYNSAESAMVLLLLNNRELIPPPCLKYLCGPFFQTFGTAKKPILAPLRKKYEYSRECLLEFSNCLKLPVSGQKYCS